MEGWKAKSGGRYTKKSLSVPPTGTDRPLRAMQGRSICYGDTVTAEMPVMVPTNTRFWKRVGVAKRVVEPTLMLARSCPLAISRA